MGLESMLASQTVGFNTDTLLDSCLHLPQLKELLYRPCFIQRLKVSKEWAIDPGQNILDIGCGQGESCLVLAREGGSSTIVTGIDTGAPGMLVHRGFFPTTRRCKINKSIKY